MPDIKLVAVDLDGTLLNNNSEVSSHTKAVIQACSAKGIPVVPITMRDSRYVSRLCADLDIRPPMGCLNGAQVYSAPEGELWAQHFMPASVVMEIARFADERGWYLTLTDHQHSYWRQKEGQPLGLIQPGRMVVTTNSEGIQGDILRVLCHDLDAMHPLRDFCLPYDACRTEFFYKPDGSLNSLAIFAPRANKGDAVTLICDRLNIPLQQVMAVGDNLNDLPMFARAGVRVAMDNAVPELKEKASVIAPDNDHDGVAWALENYVL